MIDRIRDIIETNIGIDGNGWVVDGALLVSVLLIAVVGYYVAKAIVVLVEKIVLRSETEWDDDLINPAFTRAVSQIAPALLTAYLLPRFFPEDEPNSVHWLSVLTSYYILWAIIHIFTILIDNFYHALLKRENLRVYAIKGVFQMVKLIFWSIGVVIALSMVMGRTPLAILGTLGASAAVLMLVFKDTIMGFVASVQLTANKMVKRGDWIKSSKHSVNGVVEDVSLTTVKIRNWDNTVTTIPPYTLISDSFQNMHPMQVSGGRRVSRALYIDALSVRPLIPSELSTLRASLLAEGFADLIPDASSPSSIVNLTLLRRYIEAYLSRDPRVNQSMLRMVRQLDPTPQGLPVELYFFTSTTVWVDYEHIQSDIFDHVYATLSRFHLRVYQHPSGTDLRSLA